MRTFVINLERAAERRAHMETLLGSAGIAFERFDAVDGDQARRHPAFDQIPAMAVRPWGAGELGCLLSHYEVWRTIAAGPDRFGAVLEDDLFIDPRLQKLLGGHCALPRDADLIKLEAVGDAALVSRRALSSPGGPAFHRLYSKLYGTGAYLISRRTARFLLGAVSAFDMPVDELLFSPRHRLGRRFRTYQAVPGLAMQSSLLPNAAARPALKSRLEVERFTNSFLHDRQNPNPPAPERRQDLWRSLTAPPLEAMQHWHQKAFMRPMLIEFGGGP